MQLEGKEGRITKQDSEEVPIPQEVMIGSSKVDTRFQINIQYISVPISCVQQSWYCGSVLCLS